jgi:hypothetical protein
VSAGSLLRRLVRPAAGAGAAVLVLALAQAPASGAFTAQTGATSGTVTASANFCVSPGAQDLVVANDAWTDEAAGTTAHGTTTALEVASADGADSRSYLRFTLPGVPRHCALVSAQLRLRANAPVVGRTIDVLRADPAQSPQWAAGSLTWNTQPAAVGTAVGSASLSAAGIQTWNVTAHTLVLLGGPNNGFVLKDRNEDAAGAGFVQRYDEQSTAGGTPAVLRLTWG